MTERGMIFNAEMVRAILDGRKTQTRRIMKPQPEVCPRGGHWWSSNVFKTMLHVEEEMQNGKGGWNGLAGDACPFGTVGDRIWVREAFRVMGCATDVARLMYKASERNSFTESTRTVPVASCTKQPSHKWTPSIHMPRWASRIMLEITDVRVERLVSITDEDAGKEGYPANPEPFGGRMDKWLWFRQVWDGLYPEQSFKHNPWVWVIEFKLVDGGEA